MQDRYVGDVGDFGKYALLRALADNTLRLGVLWYLNSSEEDNRDGKFTNYDDLAHCDSVLFDKLHSLLVSEKRLVTEVERGNILPRSALFYRTSIPAPAHPCYTSEKRKNQMCLRENWFLTGSTRVQRADLVFLDPDNGIAGESSANYHKRSVKYAFSDEITRLLGRKQSVIVYQHQQRKRLERQISDQLKPLRRYCASPFAVSFHARSVRIYYVLPANEGHGRILLRRAAEFTSGCWKQVFRLHS